MIAVSKKKQKVCVSWRLGSKCYGSAVFAISASLPSITYCRTYSASSRASLLLKLTVWRR